MEEIYVVTMIFFLLFTMIGVPIIIAIIAKKNEKTNQNNVSQTFTKNDHASLQINSNKSTVNSSESITSYLNSGFKNILDKMAADRGFSIFLDIPKCKSLLHDYAAGQYKKECRILLLAIEAGCTIEIANSIDPEITNKKLIEKLHEYFSLEYSVAEQIILFLYEVHKKVIN